MKKTADMYGTGESIQDAWRARKSPEGGFHFLGARYAFSAGAFAASAVAPTAPT